jgi:hypothetical protein
MDDPSQANVIAGVESALGLQIEAVTTVTEKLDAAMHRLYASPGSPWTPPLSGGNVIIGPIRDHAVAELVAGASSGVGVTAGSSPTDHEARHCETSVSVAR